MVQASRQFEEDDGEGYRQPSDTTHGGPGCDHGIDTRRDAGLHPGNVGTSVEQEKSWVFCDPILYRVPDDAAHQTTDYHGRHIDTGGHFDAKSDNG